MLVPLWEAPTDRLVAEAARQAAEQEAWDAFRAAHPARFATQQRTQQKIRRPKKSEQTGWTVYKCMVQGSSIKIFQQHLVVPVLVPQPLAGPTPLIEHLPGTAPFQGLTRDTEHVTNIRRMGALLREHPEVGEVRLHKPHKALDRAVWNPPLSRSQWRRPPESARPAHPPRSHWRGHGSRVHGERDEGAQHKPMVEALGPLLRGGPGQDVCDLLGRYGGGTLDTRGVCDLVCHSAGGGGGNDSGRQDKAASSF